MIWIILGILLLIIAGGVTAMLIITLPISKRVYEEQLVKTSPDKWGRVCSAPENEEQLAMWKMGCLWAEERKDNCTEVKIKNDGLDLYGEYYALNESKKCVIIVPGRCECLKYSYYFAPPYEKSGFNVLVIDPRAHGKSDGKYNTIGVKESKDLIAWINYIKKEFGIEEVYFHCICVGTASALLALNSESCPSIAKGIVTEGCFTSFRETFKRHMMDIKRPLFPVLDLCMWQIKRHTGTKQSKAAPIRLVKKLKARVLFLYGKNDIFSVPAMSQKLFKACASNDKNLVWFNKGGHSHLRINNTELYDNSIMEFLSNEN